MTAAESAASRQWAVPVRTTPRNVLSVSPFFSVLYGSAFSHACTAAGVRRRAITRRSATVNASGGGSAGSVRGSGGRGEVRDELRRRPVIPGVQRNEPPVGTDDGGNQIVGDVGGTLWIPLDVDAELRGETGDFLRITGGERPDRRVGAAAPGMRLQDRRRIELRVEW